jgi:hypothetical protein
MKKYVLFIFTAAILFSMNILAQKPQENKGERKMPTAQMRADRLAKELSLNDEEKAKVLAVYEKNDAAFSKFRQEVSRDDPDFRVKMKALRDAQDAELKEALGAEKIAQLQKLNEERMQKMKDKQNSNPN